MLPFNKFIDKSNVYPNELKSGDRVRNCNKECEHYGSTGTVKHVIKLVDNNNKNVVGNEIEYVCDCDGKTWKKGQHLKKTEIQLKKI